MTTLDSERPRRALLGPGVLARPVVLLLALTFSTGVIDASGYLGLDRVFTGNMTGNVVVLGMGLMGGNGLPVLGPVTALVAFAAGAAAAGRVVRRVPEGWGRRATVLFAVEAALLAGGAIACAALGNVHAHPVAQYVVTALLGLAMGMQAATARRIAVKDVTTVVVTSTLTGLAADGFRSQTDRGMWLRRFTAVLLMVLGAVTGAALVQLHLAFGLALSAALTAAVTVL
ncbi:MAG: YoaK family protein, partial [Amnibacterium sp.]